MGGAVKQVKQVKHCSVVIALTRGGEVAQRPQRLLRQVAPTLVQLWPGGTHEPHQHAH